MGILNFLCPCLYDENVDGLEENQRPKEAHAKVNVNKKK